MDTPPSAIVAGHICLDIIPDLSALSSDQFATLFQPGRLILTGAAQLATGGPVANTGLALHRLGIPTRLMAKVGADTFGRAVRDLITAAGADASGLREEATASTSYSVILSPPGVDRIFLHHPGANDSFSAADVDYKTLDSAAVFHFGYPPVMRQMYRENGQQLAELLRRAKATGITTSLDMALPDPLSEGGKVNWVSIYTAALPYVDIFLPSFEELLFTLQRETYTRLCEKGDLLAQLTPELLHDLTDQVLEMGVRVALIKLGHQGAYLRTSSAAKIGKMGRAAPASPKEWARRELWAPCFQVAVVGTTGSGDATIAGFLSGLLRGMSATDALLAGVAVGACNVEAADALSGIRSWEETQSRLRQGWARCPLHIQTPGWTWNATTGVWFAG